MDGQSWYEKKLEALVGAAGEASRRSRYVFMATNIAGLMMLSVSFNAYLSWGRKMGSLTGDPLCGPAGRAFYGGSCAPAPARREGKDARDFLWVEVSAIGLKFHAYDLQIVGTVAMGLLAFWGFFSLRREHHVVSEVVKEANRALAENHATLADWLFHAVDQRMVFNPARLTPDGEEDDITLVGIDIARYLTWMPVWVPGVVVLCDILSLFVAHPFGTVPDEGLLLYLFRRGDGATLLELALRIGFATFMALSVNRALCAKSSDLQTKTRGLLHGLAKQLPR